MTDLDRQIVFYGTLMRGGGARQALGIGHRLRFSSECRLRGRLLDLGAYPGLVGPEDETIESTVAAELWEILDWQVLGILDRFEGFDPADPVGSRYRRRRIRLLEPPTEAWVYLFQGPEAVGAPIVESGRWPVDAATGRGLVQDR